MSHVVLVCFCLWLDCMGSMVAFQDKSAMGPYVQHLAGQSVHRNNMFSLLRCFLLLSENLHNYLCFNEHT